MEVTNIIELFDLSEFDDPSTRPFLFDEIVEGKRMVFDFSSIILIRYGRSTKLVLFSTILSSFGFEISENCKKDLRAGNYRVLQCCGAAVMRLGRCAF